MESDSVVSDLILLLRALQFSLFFFADINILGPFKECLR